MKQGGSQSPELTHGFVLDALSLHPTTVEGAPTGLAQRYASITTDSRRAQPGQLFVALPGDRFDGHQFLDAVVAQGVSGVICRKGSAFTQRAGIHIYWVDDTVAAFRQLAHAWRREFRIPIVAIGGSAGKTTTKELFAAILRGKYSKVLKTQASQNGFIGIPMTLMDLRADHEVAVVEIGIDEIGAMKQHVALVEPTDAVLTAVGPEHLEKLRDVPTVAQEEGLLLQRTAASGGRVAINLDDPWIRPHAAALRQGERLSFKLVAEFDPNLSQDSVLQGQIVKQGAQTALKFRGLKLSQLQLECPLPGEHNARNLIAAVTLARGLGLSSDEIKAGLLTFAPAPGRSELAELPGGTPVLRDFYNAQPASVEAGLRTLASIAAERGVESWACLADMLEMGRDEEKYHRDIAQLILQLGITRTWLFGTRMLWLEDELKKRSYKGDLRTFATQEAMGQALVEQMRPGACALLIKGSRSMRMERCWEVVQAHASQARGS